MTDGKRIWLLMLAILPLLTACGDQYVERTQVFRDLIATHDLKAGQIIQENDLRVVERKHLFKEKVVPSPAPWTDKDVPQISKLVGLKLIHDVPSGSKFQVGHDCAIADKERFSLLYEKYKLTNGIKTFTEGYCLVSEDLSNKDKQELLDLLKSTRFLDSSSELNHLALKPDAEFVSVVLARDDFGCMGGLSRPSVFGVGDFVVRELLSNQVGSSDKKLIAFIVKHGEESLSLSGSMWKPQRAK